MGNPFDFLFGGNKKIGGEGYVNMEDVNQLRNQQIEYNKMLGETAGQVNAFSPEAATAAFLSSAPDLQRFIQGATSDYSKQQMDMAALGSQKGIQGVFDQFANQGASARSGAAMGAASEAGMLPYMNAVNNITSQQNQMLSPLLAALQGMPYQEAGLDLGLHGNYAGLQGGVNSALSPIYEEQSYEKTNGLIPTALSLVSGISGLGKIGSGISSLFAKKPYDASSSQKDWTGRQ